MQNNKNFEVSTNLINRFSTFVFHDYETYGAETKKLRASQFASINTDSKFNIIDSSKKNFYADVQLDYVPDIEASFITGVTPIDVKGFKESKEYPVYDERTFFKVINSLFSKENTCSLGFNSINFDDEVSRNGFYRNLLPIYKREFDKNCARYDIYPMAKMFSFFYSDKLNLAEEGSMKLSNLSSRNGFIPSGGYHDALVDVEATIFITNMFKDLNPKLFNHLLNVTNKQYRTNEVNHCINNQEILLVESSYFGSESMYVRPILPIMYSSKNKNKLYGIDLSQTELINKLVSLTKETFKPLYDYNSDELTKEEMKEKFKELKALFSFELNKAPAMIPEKSLDQVDIHNLNQKFINIEEAKNNLKFVTDNYITIKSLLKDYVYYQDNFKYKEIMNDELKIYSNPFVNDSDANLMSVFHQNFDPTVKESIFKILANDHYFGTPYLNDMLHLMLMRNHHEEIKEYLNENDSSNTYSKVKDKFEKYLINSISMLYNGYPIANNYDYSNDNISIEKYEKNERMSLDTMLTLKDKIPLLIESINSNPDLNADEREYKLNIVNKYRDSLSNTYKTLKSYGADVLYKDYIQKNHTQTQENDNSLKKKESKTSSSRNKP